MNPHTDFPKIHRLGIERHGTRWLVANETVVHAAVRCGVNYSQPKQKLLLSLVTLHLLETFFNPKSVHATAVKAVDLDAPEQTNTEEDHGTKSITK